jgi:ABC-type multidrug transport system ATPase subunit
MRDDVPPILTIEKLKKRFGAVEALRGIDMTLAKPGVYGFLGPNGAGKTTTFKLVCGLLRPTGGRVMIGGVDVQNDAKRAVSKIGVLFDMPAYYPYLTGEENLAVFSRWLGDSTGTGIGTLLNLVGLADAKGRKVGGYSWGMKRRLGIAAALLSDPQLLLLDEPTSGLDPAGIADVRRLLPHLAWKEGRTILLSSHRMEEVSQICDHITIIHKGSITAAGTPEELSHAEPWIEIECSETERAAGILSELEGIKKLERTGSNSIRILAPELGAGETNSLLVENGIQVRRVAEKRESLEEIFFRLTGITNDEQ